MVLAGTQKIDQQKAGRDLPPCLLFVLNPPQHFPGNPPRGRKMYGYYITHHL